MSAYIDTLPVWPQDREAICARIIRNQAPFKVLLRTMNDPFFLERWIQHYLAIVKQTESDNQQGIIIFDNMSTDAEVLRLYEKYRNDLQVVRFADKATKLHNMRENLDLYLSITASSHFYAFLDTDEFLYLSDGERFTAGAAIGEYLAAQKEVNFFGSLWLENEPESYNTFKFRANDIIRQLLYGKPILNSAAMRKSIRKRISKHPVLLHNLDIGMAHYCKTPVCFVLAHYNKFLAQRLRASLNLLVLYEVFNSADFANTAELYGIRSPADLAALAGQPKFADLLKVDPATVHPHPRKYLLDVQTLLSGQMLNKIAEDDRTFGPSISLGMQDNGRLVFSSQSDQALLQKYLGGKTDFFETLGIQPPTGEQLDQNVYACLPKANMHVIL